MTTCESTDEPLIKVSDPGQLIETIPYLVGFHPSESLVLVGFARADSGLQRVTVTMRVDLGFDELDPMLVASLGDALHGSGTECFLAMMFTDEISGDPRRALPLVTLRRQLEADLTMTGVGMIDALVVTSTRWWSLCCRRRECCPDAGTPRLRGESAAEAEATYAGLVAFPDRDSLAETLTGASDADRTAMEPVLAAARSRVLEAVAGSGSTKWREAELAAFTKAAQRHPGHSGAVTDRQAARFAAALTDVAIRDAVWLRVDDGSLAADSLLTDLHTRVPMPYDAAPVFLWGWSQWRAGNGTLATMAAERALSSDPAYSAAHLLLGTVQHGLDPRSTPRLTEPELEGA